MTATDPTDIWAWLQPDRKRFRDAGGQLAAIESNYRAFWNVYHDDFAAADAAITAAIDAAHATGERKWELHLRHWRLQLWLQDDLTRVLPEAVDLLSLATDEQLRDVPQRICAIHDLVDCYDTMDPVGYQDEIVQHVQQTLAELPQRHPCADCARSQIADVMCEAGRLEEAEYWIAQRQAHNFGSDGASQITGRGDRWETLGRWDDAIREFTAAAEKARKENEREPYLVAQMGLARAHAAKGELPQASEALRSARHIAKYTGNTARLARLLAVEGYVAEAADAPEAAIDYFTRSATQNLALGRYRSAALVALHGAELAQAHNQDATALLDLAARAIGYMPPASRDVRARLATFGRAPIDPPPPGHIDPAVAAEPGDASANERKALEDTLQAHIATGNARGVALALYRLGRWHDDHQAPRAAVDYFILNAMLERILQMPMNDREDALNALRDLDTRLPAGTVEAALRATEAGPPPWLAPLVSQMPPARWAWLVRAVAAELRTGAAVEPEPHPADERDSFGEWVDSVASMAALLVRHGAEVDSARRATWAGIIDEQAQALQRQAGDDPQAGRILSFMRAIAALARGVPPAEVTAQPPFADVLAQIIRTAQRPVWQHPGLAPLEFLVEDCAQRAVRALRQHDEHRAERLANLTLRYDLMLVDLRSRDQLAPIASFVAALSQFVASGGAALPTPEPPLVAPFDAILVAVAETSKAGTA
jgi:tetratricopeptide (TPR) repeat protein